LFVSDPDGCVGLPGDDVSEQQIADCLTGCCARLLR